MSLPALYKSPPAQQNCRQRKDTEMKFFICIVLLWCYVLNDPVTGSVEEGVIRPFILESTEEAKKLVNDAYLYSCQESLVRVRKADAIKPMDKLRLMKQPREAVY